MYSICIPVYNFDVRELVKELHRQAKIERITFEIILADDRSAPIFKEKNRECSSLSNVRIIELEKNIGRSQIRNLLADKAQYPWLIFMDCDSMCPDENYIKRYVENTTQDLIVCGGRSYLPTPPQDGTYLHWLYGTHREVKTASERQVNPNHSFMTNNFMISKELLKKIPFNESLSGYGHEDTLMGYDLLKKQIRIRHIDNPLIHIGLQDAKEFLLKTRDGTRNLLKIYCIIEGDKDLLKMVKLLRVWHRVRKYHLCRLFAVIFRAFEGRMVKKLRKKKPSLFWLDIYKLGNICRQTIKFQNS